MDTDSNTAGGRRRKRRRRGQQNGQGIQGLHMMNEDAGGGGNNVALDSDAASTRPGERDNSRLSEEAGDLEDVRGEEDDDGRFSCEDEVASGDEVDGVLNIAQQLDGDLCLDETSVPGETSPHLDQHTASARTRRVRVGGRAFVEESMGMRGWPFANGTQGWPSSRNTVGELKRSWLPSGKVLDLTKDDVPRDPDERVSLSIDVDAVRTYCEVRTAGETIQADAVVAILKNPLPTERIAGGKLRIQLYNEETRVRAQDFTTLQVGVVRGAPQLGDIKMYLILTHFRPTPATPGARSVSRRADHDDIRRFQDALAKTIQTLSSDMLFKGAFGGPVQTADQLRLASHQEVFYVPSSSEARGIFFRTLNSNLKDFFGFPSDGNSTDPLMFVLKGFNQKHILCCTLTRSGEAFDRSTVLNNTVAFAARVYDTVASVIDPDFNGAEISVDLALNMAYENHSGLIIVPRTEYYTGQRGASSRSGAAHEAGRGGDLRLGNVTPFSLLGTDQAASISGHAYAQDTLPKVDRDPILDEAHSAISMAEDYDKETVARTNLNVYSPTVLHTTSSAKGHAFAVAFRGSAVSNAVEVARGLEISGAYLSKKRHSEVAEARQRGETAASCVLSGVKGADGALRAEATYLFRRQGDDSCFARALEVMCGDLLVNVYGLEDDGWTDPDATFALPSEVVHGLLGALYWRALSTIEYGLAYLPSPSGDEDSSPRQQLPLGHLASIAERTLVSDALSLRLPGVIGSELRAGLAQNGFLAFTDHAGWVAKMGGDDRLPVGLFVGPRGGRRGGGFGAGVREFLTAHSVRMPAKNRGGLDLRNDGGESLLGHLRHVIFLIMQAALDAVKKKGLLPADFAVPGGEVGEDNGDTWCPQESDLIARNRELEQDPEMARKRFALPSLRKTVTVSAYLGKVLPNVDGVSMENVPPPYVVLFNALLQSFCAEPRHQIITAPVCRMWLIILMEALVTEELGMKIFPKAKPNRLFATVGQFARVDNSASKAVTNKFVSLFEVSVPALEDGLVTAVLTCFHKAVFSAQASLFVPDLEGGTLPSLGLLAAYRGPPGRGSAGSGDGRGGADHGGSGIGVTGTADPASGLAASGGDGPEVADAGGSESGAEPAESVSTHGDIRSTPQYAKSWRVVDAHNVQGNISRSNNNPNRLTHPVQLLAYSLGAHDLKGSFMKQVKSSPGILSAFASTHINDLPKAIKPAERAKQQQEMWLSGVTRTLGLIYDDAGDAVPMSNVARASGLYNNAVRRAESVDIPMFGRYATTMDQLLAAACMVLSGLREEIGKGTAADALRHLFLNPSASSASFLTVADEGRHSMVSRAMAGLVTRSVGKKNEQATQKWEAFRLASVDCPQVS